MKTIKILSTMVLLNFAAPAWAEDGAKSHDMAKMHMNMSKEDREKMAAAHSQMATCLRSDQEIKACHEVLHKECQSMMGDSCSGMDMEKGKRKGTKSKK